VTDLNADAAKEGSILTRKRNSYVEIAKCLLYCLTKHEEIQAL